MNKTKKCRFKKQPALQKTRSNKQQIQKRLRLSNCRDQNPLVARDGAEEDYDDDDNILSNMFKRFWSLFGY